MSFPCPPTPTIIPASPISPPPIPSLSTRTPPLYPPPPLPQTSPGCGHPQRHGQVDGAPHHVRCLIGTRCGNGGSSSAGGGGRGGSPRGVPRRLLPLLHRGGPGTAPTPPPPAATARGGGVTPRVLCGVRGAPHGAGRRPRGCALGPCRRCLLGHPFRVYSTDRINESFSDQLIRFSDASGDRLLILRTALESAHFFLLTRGMHDAAVRAPLSVR